MKHLWAKLNCNPKEWRRIFKALNCMDYLVKNGAPRCIQDMKDDMFKISQLKNFSYRENGTEKGQGVRDKSEELCTLLNDP
jgi:epsin